MSRRRALVIGIDRYPGFGPESQLFGAVRDARTMAEVLVERHGFAPADVVTLADEQATRRAVLDALASLRLRAGAGDHVVVFFSGHGSQMTDRENDEGDGLDETLVLYDGGRGEAENRDVTDDEINCWAARVLDVTPHVTLIFDCCHGGTLQRPGWRVKHVPPDLRPVDALPPSPVPRRRDVGTGPRPLVAAACRDDEVAVELPPSIAGVARGAFSFHFIEALRQASPTETWREVFERAAKPLALDPPKQHPQLSGDGLDEPVLGGERSGELGRGAAGLRLRRLADRRNRYKLRMELFRSRNGPWRRTRPPSFVAGDRLRVDLRHGHERALYVYLLDVGLTCTVTLLFPDLDGHEALDERRPSLVVGERRGDALELFVPDDLPQDQDEGVGHLLLVASERRLSTARLLSGSVRILGDVCAIARRYRLRRS
ncbi:MAG TPA: caspase family protein [Thermoanaerobaculia bacterium]